MQSNLKSLLIIGGSGALGKSIVTKFNTSNPLWNIIVNIDFHPNTDASHNIIINKNNFTTEVIKKITQDFEKEQFLKNYDCIVNVAGGWTGQSLKNEEIIVSSDNMHQQNVLSSILAAHLATKYLNKNGLLVLTGSATVKDGYNANMLAYQLAKNSVHYLTDLLVNNPQELPEKTKLITLLP